MRILISGASRGLGRTLAEKLAAAGHDLILLARSLDKLEELKVSLDKKVNVQIHAIDLSREEEIKQIEKIEGVDVLINNVGNYREVEASKLDTAELQQQLDINLWSAIHLTQAILPQFKTRKSALIININSVMGISAAGFASTYSISKHALKGWNDSLREELRSSGIKVSGIYPGAINTTSWDGEKVNREAMIQTEDIAELVKSLLKMTPSTLVEEIHLSPTNF